jgi:DNA-binding PucR family transcriptional regulator
VLQIGAGAFERVGSANFPTIAGRVARALGAPGAPLLVPQGETRAYVWIGSPSPAAVAESIAAEAWPAGLQLSVSGVHDGLAGFRRAHAEAIAADRVARLAPQRQITDYGQVELASLLTTDLGRAAEFVTRTLGALSVDDPRIVDLRKTLAAYIDAGGGLAETAQRLYVHRNTVAYRLQQIKAVIGPDYDATSVRVAIMLVDELPLLMSASPRQAPAVLRDLFPEAGPESRP